MSDHGKPTLDELQERVLQSFGFYAGSLPTEASLAWQGYFAALIEWGLISVSDHDTLIKMLPRDTMLRPNDDPIMHIFLGWDDLSHLDET